MELAIGTGGEPVNVQIETRSGSIRAKVWRVKVGRCDLLLLDSNVEGNARKTANLPRVCTAATGAFAFARSCCWEWGDSAR